MPLHRSVPECTAFTGLWEAAAVGCRSRGFRVKVSLLSILLARFILLSCGRRRDNLNRWFNSTRSHFKQTSRYQSSLSLSEAFFSPPCKNQFILLCLEVMWNVHTAQGRASLLNVGGPCKPAQHLPFHLCWISGMDLSPCDNCMTITSGLLHRL